jgi:XRE family transcriptional regulator, regulator of sulfur utilization
MSSVAPPNLGPLLNHVRKKRGLTLETLATTSGVSRSMLSQIERGGASPTFSTLWNITQALGLSLADLNGEPCDIPPIDILLGHNTPEITTTDKLCTLRILSPTEATGKTEWYLLTLAKGGILSSDPHVQGTTEHLTVFDGRIEISSAGQEALVESGETARYAAAVAHAIRNIGPNDARALLVVMHGKI